jgi:hypothetical protein
MQMTEKQFTPEVWEASPEHDYMIKHEQAPNNDKKQHGMSNG